MRILVIEDDADICSICEHIFTWAGHEVAAALDGEPGLELVESFEPDVLALDIMMPGVDGLSVLAELRGSVLTRDLPVVVVSARTLNADRLRAFEAGADDYVSKPFDPNVLLQVLERACHGSPEERAAWRQQEMRSLRVESYP